MDHQFAEAIASIDLYSVPRLLLAVLLVLYSIDHGIDHIKHRSQQCRGHWYHSAVIAILVMGMCSYVWSLLSHV